MRKRNYGTIFKNNNITIVFRDPLKSFSIHIKVYCVELATANESKRNLGIRLKISLVLIEIKNGINNLIIILKPIGHDLKIIFFCFNGCVEKHW